MKKIYGYNQLRQCILAFVSGLLLTGCSAEDNFSNISMEPQLGIVPLVNDIKVATRAEMQDAHEKELSSLDFKLFENENANLIDVHYNKGEITEGETMKIADGDWMSQYELSTKKYDFYVAANTKLNLNGKSAADIKTATQEDDDIWQTYTESNKKSFLMSCIDSYQVTNEATQTIPFQLVRAAAKIQLNLTANVEDYKATSVKWKLINYNTNTSVFKGQKAEAKIITDNGEAPTNDVVKIADQKFSVTTYSYSTSWENNSEAPQIIVAIDFKSNKDGSVIKKTYAIPVRDVNQAEKELERNHIYTINAEIKNLNRSTEITYGVPDFMTYAITKWSEGGTTNVNGGKASYLVVYPTLLIMKNEREDKTSVKFFGSDVCNVKDHYAYYYDKNGNKVTNNVQAGQAIIESGKKTGTVHIISDVPTNLTVKYIHFTIYCGNKNDGTYCEQEVLIKQYPLEFIQNIEGWYSTKSNNGWIDWQRDNSRHQSRKMSSDSYFHAKIYENGNIYNYSDRKQWGNAYMAEKEDIQTGQSNNHMYVVQITSTNADYKIGHVTNIDSKTMLSQEDVVSPAFALASQLGTVQPFENGKTASQHCKDYVETGKNGKTYDGWRLPTQKEIEVIGKYQSQNGQDAISKVLEGGAYWALNGKQVRGNKDENEKDSGYVRCVRDLTPEEVQELENEREQ